MGKTRELRVRCYARMTWGESIRQGWKGIVAEQPARRQNSDREVFGGSHRGVFAADGVFQKFDCLLREDLRSMSTSKQNYSGTATAQSRSRRRTFARRTAREEDTAQDDLSPAARVEGCLSRFFLTHDCAADSWSGTKVESVCLAQSH